MRYFFKNKNLYPLFLVIFMFFIGKPLSAQIFQPYQEFGLQIALSNDNFNESFNTGAISMRPEGFLADGTYGIKISGYYDITFRKWIGLTSGIGFEYKASGSHAETVGSLNPKPDVSINLLYVSVPLLVQLKPSPWFVFEIGSEMHRNVIFNIRGDESNYQYIQLPLVDIGAVGRFRFNLLENLSLYTAIHWGLSPTMFLMEMNPKTAREFQIDYQLVSLSFGLRYGFKRLRI